MSTYKNYAAGRAEIVNGWISRDGVVGTAHYSIRKGAWLDFRPAKIIEHVNANTVTFFPQKGVDVGPNLVSVEYHSLVSVDYEGGTWVRGTPTCRPMLEEGNVPATWTFHHPPGSGPMPEFPGFPAPESIRVAHAAIAAAKAAQQAEWSAFCKEGKITHSAYAEWLEGITDPQERKWVGRWLNTGKAMEQVLSMANKRFPISYNSDVLRTMRTHREEWRQK